MKKRVAGGTRGFTSAVRVFDASQAPRISEIGWFGGAASPARVALQDILDLMPGSSQKITCMTFLSDAGWAESLRN